MSNEEKMDKQGSEESTLLSSESSPPSLNLCAVCGKTGAVYCPRCRLVAYCSHDHRLNDWDRHDTECVVVHPVKIKKISREQRALVVRNHFKSGAMIFVDTPIIRGPDDNLLSPEALRYCFLTSSKQRSTCIACCSLVLDGRTCPKCQWPVCSEKCAKDPIHSLMECAIFHGKPETDFSLVKPSRFVLILRCLLTKETDPKTWNKILSLETNPMSKQLERMLEERSPISDKQLKRFHAIDKEILMDVMNHLSHFQLQKRFSINVVSRVIQILNWNALPLELGGKRDSMLLFPRVTIAQHSCVPNALWFMKSTYRLFCHARVEIAVDEPLLISRISDEILLMCTKTRQQFLRMLSIHCSCERCMSPTELGSNLSTVKCINFEFFDSVKGCMVGNLEPMDPINPDSLWKCQTCQCTRPARLVQNYMTRIQLELDETKQLATTLKYKKINFAKAKHLADLLGLQKFITVLKHHEGKTLHKNHSLIFHAKYFVLKHLSQGMAELFGLNIAIKPKIMELLVDAAAYVENLCDDCLSIMETILPGFSLRYGEIIYYKQFSLGILLPEEFRRHKQSLTTGGNLVTFRKRFEEAKKLREKSRFILSFYNEAPEVSKMLEFMMLDETLYATLQKHIFQFAPETVNSNSTLKSSPTNTSTNANGWNNAVNFQAFEALF